MGAEFQLSLVTYAADSSVPLFNALGVEVARLKPTFSGRRVTIRIPRTALGGDDGYLNAAAIAGTVNSPSDIIPEAGHLHLDAAFTAIQSVAMLREAADSAPSRLLAEGPVASYLPSFIESCQDRPSQAAGTPWTSALDFRPISVLPSRSSASSAAAGCPASSWRTRSDSPAG
jgi:hypothetical protein